MKFLIQTKSTQLQVQQLLQLKKQQQLRQLPIVRLKESFKTVIYFDKIMYIQFKAQFLRLNCTNPQVETKKQAASQSVTRSSTIRNELAQRSCKAEENVFFLKTSKTGSQTLMAIMQRFGIRHDSSFFVGESMNGAMSQVHVPISAEKDCWIGKHLNITFNISTQHLKYNS